VNETRLYGTATARSWGRLHPRLTHPSAWTAQLGALPVIEGAVIRLQVEHLPSGATPKPVWLWWSGSDATGTEVDLLWQAFLRRFWVQLLSRMRVRRSSSEARPYTARLRYLARVTCPSACPELQVLEAGDDGIHVA
jgi:hypothetical protein